jgi:hypothetical protein
MKERTFRSRATLSMGCPLTVIIVNGPGSGKLALLTTGGDLHAYHVRGCFGLFHNGDPFTISATFTQSPKQTITSP